MTTDVLGDYGGVFVVVFKYLGFKVFCDRHVNFFEIKMYRRFKCWQSVSMACFHTFFCMYANLLI